MRLTSIWPPQSRSRTLIVARNFENVSSHTPFDGVLRLFRLRLASVVILHTVSIRPVRTGTTHQTSIEGSAEVIWRSRRLSEKTGEFLRLASLRCFNHQSQAHWHRF